MGMGSLDEAEDMMLSAAAASSTCRRSLTGWQPAQDPRHSAASRLVSEWRPYSSWR